MKTAHTIVTVLSVATFTAGYGFPDCVNGPLANNSVCDTSLDAKTRATALIKLFTTDELINNTVNLSPGVPRLGLPAYQWWSEGLVRVPYLPPCIQTDPLGHSMGSLGVQA